MNGNVGKIVDKDSYKVSVTTTLSTEIMAKKRTLCDCGRVYKPKIQSRNKKVVCQHCLANLKSSEVKKKAVEFLGGKCVECGYNKHTVALDFDHIDPKQKSFKISGNFNLRWSDLKKELMKCQILCSNCHRIKHYNN